MGVRGARKSYEIEKKDATHAWVRFVLWNHIKENSMATDTGLRGFTAIRFEIRYPARCMRERPAPRRTGRTV